MKLPIDVVYKNAKAAIERSKLLEEEKSALLKYAEGLHSSGFPVIFSLRHLAALMGLRPYATALAVFRTEQFYHSFRIKKRAGGERVIDAPSPILLHAQRWIAENILNRIPIAKDVHGFLPARSAKTNAQVHLGSAELLKVDIKDFFPSIKAERVTHFFKGLGYSPAVSSYLSRICTKGGIVTQGSAASPALSNVLMRWVDHRLARLALTRGLIYSRYADDLTFSGARIDFDITKTVATILRENGFSLNLAKTRHVKKTSKKIVSGISISSGILKLPRETRRSLSLEVFLLQKNGLDWMRSVRGGGDPLYEYRLRGRLSYWLHIQPSCRIARIGIDLLGSGPAGSSTPL